MLESDRIVREQARCCAGATDALRCAADFLRHLDSRGPCVRDRVISDLCDPSFRRGAEERVRETSSHFVWRLSAECADALTSAWVNEYKGASQRTAGYASTVHDHRYDFVSIVLSGGYEYTWYLVDDVAGIVGECGGGSARSGDVVMVENSSFHRISGIQENTMTFLLKFPPVKESSTSVDLDSGRLRHHVAHGLRVDRLLTALKGAE